MIFTPLPLAGAYKIDLDKQEDTRGFFARYFCEYEYAKHGLETRWVQMNNTFTRERGAIRGLHFQVPPKAEAKVVRCLRGAVWDVIVDLRNLSNTFGNWYGVELNEENRTMLYIPKGFAHGFQTLMPDTELLYLHSAFHSPEHERGLRYNDHSVAIDWPLEARNLSERDQNQPFLDELLPISI